MQTSSDFYKKTVEKNDVNRPVGRPAVWFALFFSAAMSGVWEIWEFVTDQLFALNSQNGSLTDTMTDIILGDIGAAVTSVYLFRKAKRKQMLFNAETKKTSPGNAGVQA